MAADLPKEYWPKRMAIQRHGQDDPHRPFKYVVLDGTQSTDFSNTESYGLLRDIRKRERVLQGAIEEHRSSAPTTRMGRGYNQGVVRISNARDRKLWATLAALEDSNV